MFDLKREDMFNKTDQLLYNIWHELKKLNESLPRQQQATSPIINPLRPMAKATKEKKEVKITCKICRKTFSRGKFLQHMKEHKKEGNNNAGN